MHWTPVPAGSEGGSAGSPAAVPAVPGYRLERVLGRGAGGPVWRARPDGGGEPVAVKIVPAGPAADRELALLRAVQHPFVVPLLDAVVVEDGLALVLTLVEGGSLRSLVAARGHLTPGEVVTVVSPLAGALADLHAAGVEHGDVAPGNVLLDRAGRPLLADLGTVRVTGIARDEVFGSAGYVDPVVLAGDAPTPASDVYGLGAVAWFALTGAPPPAAPLRPALPELVPEAPPALLAAVEAAVDPDPARRPAPLELARAVHAACRPAALWRSRAGPDDGELTRRLRAACVAARDDDEDVLGSVGTPSEAPTVPPAVPRHRRERRRDRLRAAGGVRLDRFRGADAAALGRLRDTEGGRARRLGDADRVWARSRPGPGGAQVRRSLDADATGIGRRRGAEGARAGRRRDAGVARVRGSGANGGIRAVGAVAGVVGVAGLATWLAVVLASGIAGPQAVAPPAADRPSGGRSATAAGPAPGRSAAAEPAEGRSAPERIAATAGPFGDVRVPATAHAIVSALLDRRAAELATPARIGATTLLGSPAAAGDAAARRVLLSEGLSYRGVRMSAHDLRVVSVAADRAAVRLRLGVSGYRVVDGRGRVRYRVAARRPRQVVLDLARTAAGWRVRSVAPG